MDPIIAAITELTASLARIAAAVEKIEENTQDIDEIRRELRNLTSHRGLPVRITDR